ncbi:hypothetical protein Y1Q_0019605 [Alligator mississippiensis]|uniref:Uncharacterized protein n=1 Tax=Alligator mississippiensis TaxID=8496 RepID=A0A151PEK5_ALLMI|nr:hypothetical protein Y1Q_0019605 [Alligator mississippiensis]
MELTPYPLILQSSGVSLDWCLRSYQTSVWCAPRHNMAAAFVCPPGQNTYCLCLACPLSRDAAWPQVGVEKSCSLPHP